MQCNTKFDRLLVKELYYQSVMHGIFGSIFLCPVTSQNTHPKLTFSNSILRNNPEYWHVF